MGGSFAYLVLSGIDLPSVNALQNLVKYEEKSGYVGFAVLIVRLEHSNS
jgi:hypothetical protein